MPASTTSCASRFRPSNFSTLRAVGGRVLLSAAGASAEGKAIWVIRGNNVLVEGFDFRDARVSARNGAGIRFETGSLTIRDCSFTNNEMGLLTSNDGGAELVVEGSEFAHNGAEGRHNHNLYVGSIRKLTVSGSYFHHARIGHLLKTRAGAIAPPIAAASVRTLELLNESQSLRNQLQENSRYFRGAMTSAGFRLLPGEHPIIPVMIGDAALAARLADDLLQEGIYVVGFSFPVVPKGEARIRTQMSAAHTRDQLEFAVTAFERVGRKLGVLS